MSADTNKQQQQQAATTSSYYRIGTPGKLWGKDEKEQWRNQTKIHRSYQNDVVKPLLKLGETETEQVDVVNYGELPSGYKLFAAQTKHFDDTNTKRPYVCITGGVHGYETSGVRGALAFLQSPQFRQYYAEKCNMIVFPCVSPWAYERMERWNPDCQDPNRCFLLEKAIPETQAVMNYLATLQQNNNNSQWTLSLDLHETTDSDETEYMPARAAAETGEPYEPEPIPDGFFLYLNAEKAKANNQLEWAQHVIASVQETKMHIARPDTNGQICGIPVKTQGVALLPPEIAHGDGMSFTNATYHATTELYPDAPHVTDEDCIQAQVTAIMASLDYILGQDKKESATIASS